MTRDEQEMALWTAEYVAACHLFLSREKAIIANSKPRRRHADQ